MNLQRSARSFLVVFAACNTCISDKAFASDVTSMRFHLTSHPFTGSSVSKVTILSNIKGIIGYLAALQQSSGAIPINGVAANAPTAAFVFGGATLLASGDTTYQVQTLKAMDWAASNYATFAGTNYDGPQFEAGPLAKAFALLSASGQVTASRLATWKSEIHAIKSSGNTAHNWGAYSIDGAQQLAKAGLISAATAQAFIEAGWPQQASNFYTNGLYEDKSSVPDSLAVEGVGRGRIFDTVVSGYAGASRSAMLSASEAGTTTSLSLQGPYGDAPTGGRTSDHVWADAANMASFESVAQNTSDPFLAGQYQRAADLNFQSVLRFKHGNGSYSVTKNFYPDNGSSGPNTAKLENIGYQNASSYVSYNASLLLGLAEAYDTIIAAVAETPAPSDIGGYSFNVGPDWAQVFANGGGTQVEIELAGSATMANANFWSSVGIVRIGTAGFDSRLFGDGRYTGSDGVSFAPTWQSGTGTWQHIAAKPTGYAGVNTGYTGKYTTILATPVLTIGTVVWAPLSGTTGPTFTQTLILTPDGVMSKVIQSGGSYKWGMTLPLFTTDDATTSERSVGGGIASTAAFGSTLSFLALDPYTTFTSETQILSTFGQVMPVRAVGTASEQDTFVYLGKAGLTPAALKSSLRSTSTGYTSAAGTVDGTLYSGPTSAGGYGSSIKLTSGETATFSSACNFVMQVNKGTITAMEADRAVTVVIGGNSYSLGAYTAVPVSAAAGGSAVSLKATMPSPWYVDKPYIISGTGGVSGLIVTHYTGTSAPPNSGANYIAASVHADGSWTVPFTLASHYLKQSVQFFAYNGGSKTAIKIGSVVPVVAPAVSGAGSITGH